ncbi:MAG: hypothetical protein AB8B91_22985 [Rubripirellula sp.]
MIAWRLDQRDLLQIGLLVLVVMVGGCRSSAPIESSTVAKVMRYSESAAESFAEGDTEVAIQTFRKAIHRSWAADDPYHAGTNAYNLAAVLFDRGKHADALDWLVDARVDLARAGKSAGNTFLLEAKIAQTEERFQDASRMIGLANCSPPPCTDSANKSCPCTACQESKLSCVPCLGKKIADEKASQQCRDDYQAQVHLARSRLATDQYDLALASKHLVQASALATKVCSDELRGEIHHAAAMIDLAEGQFLQAAAHFDREVTHLRLAGNYRKLPEVLKICAAAYQQVDRFDLASDRLCRAARCLFARGEAKESWDVLQQALTFVDPDPSKPNHIRLVLTAREIESVLAETAPADEKTALARLLGTGMLE